jgi:DNA-binding transcriptional ArsR family regulator
MRRSPILDALFPSTRSGILAAFFGAPDKWWYMSELAQRLKTSPSSLQRELSSLFEGGLLERRTDGKRVYYRPNVLSPVFRGLEGLFEKTAGVVPVLQGALEGLKDRIECSFLYGSMARSQESAGSDIDLMIIGATGLAEVAPALRKAERTLGRPVNPTIYTVREFQQRLRSQDHFLSNVLAGSLSFIQGDRVELEALVKPS